jgi:hypothetical protein
MSNGEAEQTQAPAVTGDRPTIPLSAPRANEPPVAADDNQIVCASCEAVHAFGPNFCPSCGHPLMGAVRKDPLLGSIVADRYKIVSVLGSGGMGVVYRCEHTKMGKAMAIKLLHGDLARDRQVLERFRREARAVSRLSSPHTVSVFDYGTSDGLTYLVMELLEGQDLAKLLRGPEPFSPVRLARLCAQACESLAEAHAKGIVHRDVKPENILVTRASDERESVKLLDFGIASLRDGEDLNDITAAGMLLGTPYYMAPEIIRGRRADPRADIYAVGAMMYRGITGVPPYPGSSPIAVLTRTLTEEFVPPSKRRPDLSIAPALEQIVCRCLQKDPEKRPQQIDEVRAALESYVAGVSGPIATIQPRRTRTLAGVSLEKTVAATRDDVEAFERKIRRGRIAAGALLVLVMLASIAAAVLALRARSNAERAANRPSDQEAEPNDSPALATVIAPGTEVRGGIGRRISRWQGDVDFFRLAPRGTRPLRLRVELAPQPNIDTLIEVFHSGNERAVFVAKESGAGEREVVAGLTLPPEGDYFLSIHEDQQGSGVPMENVSDPYVLRYTLEPLEDGSESEPNDREPLASRLALDAPGRGYIESREDQDCWCPATLPAPRTVTLTAPARMDLELVVVHHDGRAEEVTDHGGAGAIESARLAPEAGSPPCVLVRASQRNPARRGDPRAPYTLEVRP